MSHERLLDKDSPPSDKDMTNVIGKELAGAWTELRRFLVETYEVTPTLQYGGKRYGWNLQHRKGGRPLCEMYPEHGSFTALVVLGSKELEQALGKLDSFGTLTRQMLVDTPRLHDGCWLYIRVANPLTCRRDIQDVEQLILIKRKPPRKKSLS